jgi:hypothetical protein
MGTSTKVSNEIEHVSLPPQSEADEKDLGQVSHSNAMDQFVNSAKTATEAEQKMTLMQGIKLYPKAIAWSMLISTCIVMEGYDVCLINNFCELASQRPSLLRRSENGG